MWFNGRTAVCPGFDLNSVSNTLVSAIYIHLQSKWHTLMLNCLLVLPRIQCLSWLEGDGAELIPLQEILIPFLVLSADTAFLWVHGGRGKWGRTASLWVSVGRYTGKLWCSNQLSQIQVSLGKKIQGHKTPRKDSVGHSSCLGMNNPHQITGKICFQREMVRTWA